MKRRQFCVTLVISNLYAWGWQGTASAAESVISIADLFTQPSHAMTIGKHYLALFPQELDREQLITQTVGQFSPTTPLMTIKDTLMKKRQQEFQKRETVIIQGWVLSRTEARLCALLVLS